MMISATGKHTQRLHREDSEIIFLLVSHSKQSVTLDRVFRCWGYNWLRYLSHFHWISLVRSCGLDPFFEIIPRITRQPRATLTPLWKIRAATASGYDESDRSHLVDAWRLELIEIVGTILHGYVIVDIVINVVGSYVLTWALRSISFAFMCPLLPFALFLPF
jgi:hypothetical protein